ncbi:hypothetical protein CSUI_007779, partial [Cystoisospora suis]
LRSSAPGLFNFLQVSLLPLSHVDLLFRANFVVSDLSTIFVTL